jgi:hypothetical protein
MFKKAIGLYLAKFGKDGAFIHAAFAALAVLVDPALALGLVTTSFRKARITAPLALLWALWQSYWALGAADIAKYNFFPAFEPTSILLTVIVAFAAGVLIRQLVEGRFSRNAAVATAVVALIFLTQGRGGLNEVNARFAAAHDAGIGHSDAMFKIYGRVNEVQKLKGLKSPEAMAASYVWMGEMWRSLDMTGVRDYNSYIVYQQQKQADFELFKTMNAMGRSDEFSKMQEKKFDDPSYPDHVNDE